LRELFEKLQKVGTDKKNLVLLDTCFVFHMITHNTHLLPGYTYALSSFTVEELIHVSHKVHKYKVPLRNFIKKHKEILVVDTPVHPGEWEKEREFVNAIDPNLLKHLPDASDAVLVGVAIQTDSVVLTKDKHDIFQVDLINYLMGTGVSVLKEFKDLQNLP
jgi:predicted nucleic acid-binding protein